jgi:hypothetical protein
VTDPEEGLEEVRVGEGEGDEGEEGAEAALQDRRPDVLDGLVRLLVPRAWTKNKYDQCLLTLRFFVTYKVCLSPIKCVFVTFKSSICHL